MSTFVLNLCEIRKYKRALDGLMSQPDRLLG